MKHTDYTYTIGIDEVGRGPLAGPVSVCAFLVNNEYYNIVLKELSGITDSKKLSEKKREEYVSIIHNLKKRNLVNFAVSHISAKVIDRIGISRAIALAIKESLNILSIDKEKVFIYLDGSLHAPVIYNQETIIAGDTKIWQIGAASVVAKVFRDKKMCKYAKLYPEYSFEKHKGYGTKGHKQAIKKYGCCSIHRLTWIK